MKIIKKALGKEAVEPFINYEQKEWKEDISETADLEYRLYFPLLIIRCQHHDRIFQRNSVKFYHSFGKKAYL